MADEVIIKSEEIKMFGERLINLSVTLDAIHYKLVSAKITPGSTDTAKMLKTTWDDRVAKFAESIDKLRKLLYDIGFQLKKIAAKYLQTEDLNADDADKLKDLVESAKNIYPEISAVVPEVKLPDIPQPPAK